MEDESDWVEYSLFFFYQVSLYKRHKCFKQSLRTIQQLHSRSCLIPIPIFFNIPHTLDRWFTEKKLKLPLQHTRSGSIDISFDMLKYFFSTSY